MGKRDRGLRSEKKRHVEKMIFNVLGVDLPLQKSVKSNPGTTWGAWVEMSKEGSPKSSWSAAHLRKESKVQSRNRVGPGSLLETQTGLHAWKDLAFGGTEIVCCFSVGFIRVFQFSPESIF